MGQFIKGMDISSNPLYVINILIVEYGFGVIFKGIFLFISSIVAKRI